MDGLLFVALFVLMFPGTTGEHVAKIVKAYRKAMEEMK